MLPAGTFWVTAVTANPAPLTPASDDARGARLRFALHPGSAIPVSTSGGGTLAVVVSGRPRRDGAPESVLDAGDVLEAYRCRGEYLIDDLRGEFALAVWDASRESLFAARDPMGIHPLFYRRVEDGIELSPSPEELTFRAGRAEFDALTIAYWIFSGSLPAGRTFFAGVHQFPAASRLTWRPDGMRFDRYWDPRRRTRLDYLNEEETVELLERTLTDATRMVIGDRPTSVFLGGGVDSALVAAFAVEHCRTIGIEPPHAMILRFPEVKDDESKVAAMIAKELGLERTLVLLTDASQGSVVNAGLDVSTRYWSPVFSPWSGAYARMTADSAEAGRPVVLSGDGGNDYLELPWLWAADLLRRGKIGQAWRFWRAQGVYLERSIPVRKMLWHNGGRALARDALLTPLWHVAPGVVRAARRRRARAELPDWIPVDQRLRDGVAELWADSQPPSWGSHLNRGWGYRLYDPYTSEVFEKKLVDRVTTGAIAASPFYDDRVISTLVRARPETIFHSQRVKGIAHRLLRGRLSAETLARIRTTDPRDYFHGLVVREVVPRLGQEGAIQALEQLHILSRVRLNSAVAKLGKGVDPDYDIDGYLWRLLAAEAWLKKRVML